MGRIARLAEAEGGKTRAILKLAGWLFTAAFALLGSCCAVKRSAERSRERYLGWRKARRARRHAVLAASMRPVLAART